ncbi:MAG: hypothetical protein JOZ19_11190 [Rubrobacter sp.]|nr:hypothetical protein [Rubrobacter sp.]
MLLELLVFGIGLIAATVQATRAMKMWSWGIIGLIAFFVGGYVASKTPGARDTRASLLDGLFVWALVAI